MKTIRERIQNALWRIDAYIMILKCDLKFVKEEGFYQAFHDEYESAVDKDGYEYLRLK